MRRCSDCRRWEGNLSQAESLKRRFHFFRLLTGNFTNKLGIPPRFAENFVRGKHVEALLRGPSGNVWNVQLKRNGGRFFFVKGWEEFVEDHHLNEGDFLMFRYDGSLRFTVLIFNRTACERDDAKFAKNTRNATKHEESSGEDSVQIISQNCGAGNDLSMQTHVKYTSVETGEASSQHKEETIRKGLAEIISLVYEGDKEEATSQHKEETIREEIVSQQYEGDKESSVDSKFVFQQLHGRDQVDGSKQRCTYFLPSRRAVTYAEKAMILKAARSFNSCCPFCVIVMKAYSVSEPYDMNIPVEFAEAHLSQRWYSTIVLRNATGGEWTVSFYKRSKTLIFSQGWSAFVHANNLMEGDVCIFELLRGENDFILNVRIYRVVDEVTLLAVVHEN